MDVDYDAPVAEDETQKGIRLSRESLEFTMRVFSLVFRGVDGVPLDARTRVLEEAVEKSEFSSPRPFTQSLFI